MSSFRGSSQPPDFVVTSGVAKESGQERSQMFSGIGTTKAFGEWRESTAPTSARSGMSYPPIGIGTAPTIEKRESISTAFSARASFTSPFGPSGVAANGPERPTAGNYQPKWQSPYSRFSTSRPSSADSRETDLEARQHEWSKAESVKSKLFQTEWNVIQGQNAQIAQLVDSLAAVRAELHSYKVDHADKIVLLQEKVDTIKMDSQTELLERVRHLEKKISESAEQQAKESVSAQRKLQELSLQVQGDRDTKMASQSKWEHRLNYLEGFVKESVDKHAKELDSTKQRLSDGQSLQSAASQRLQAMEKSLEEFLNAHNAHRQDLEGVRLKYNEMSAHVKSEMQSKERHHSSVLERVDYLERYVVEIADKHTKELAEQAKEYTAANERFEEFLGRRIEDAQKTIRAEKEIREKLNVAMEDRLASAEKLLKESCEKHDTTLYDMEQVQKSLREVDSYFATLQTQAAADKKARDVYQTSIQQRMESVEKASSGSLDKHKEIDATLQIVQDSLARSKSEVGMLQKGLQDLHSRVGDLGPVPQRIGHIEKLIADSSDRHNKHVQDFDSVSKILNDLRSRLTEAQAQIANDKKTRDGQHSTIQQRFDALEKTVTDNCEKGKDLAASLKLTQEKHNQSKIDIDVAHKKFQETFTTTSQRVEFVAKLLGDANEKSDRHVEEIDKLHKMLQESSGRLGELQSQVAADKRTRDSQHSSAQQHLEHLQKCFGDSSERHKEVDAAHRLLNDSLSGLRGELDALGRRVQDVHGRQQELATLPQRLSHFEKYVTESSGKHDTHATDFEAVRKAMNELRDRHSELTLQLDGDKKLRDGNHSTVAQRLSYLEKVVDESVDKHKALESAYRIMQDSHGTSKSEVEVAHKKIQETYSAIQLRVVQLETTSVDSSRAHDKHTQDMERLQKGVQDCGSRLAELVSNSASEKRSRDNNQAQIQQRMELLEKVGRDTAEKQKELDYSHKLLQESFGHTGGEVDLVQKKLQDLHGRIHEHAAVPQQITRLERLIQDGTEKHDRHLQEVEGLQKSLHDFRGKLGEMQSSFASERQTRDHHHNSVVQRVDYAEKNLEEAAERYRELEAAHRRLHDAHGSTRNDIELSSKRLQEHHTTLHQRFEQMERCLGDAADKQAKELSGTQVQLMELQGRIGETQGHLRGERDAREQFASTLGQRIDYLEKVMGDSSARHHHQSKELETAVQRVQEVQNFIVGEKQVREEHHATLRLRIDRVEELVGDSVDQHRKETDAAQQKWLEVEGRFGVERQERERHNSAWEQRIKFLEERLGTSTEKSVDIADFVKVREHIDEIENSMRHQCEHQAEKHGTLEQRVHFLETKVCDSAGKHEKELELASTVAQEQQDISNRLSALAKPFDAVDYTPDGMSKLVPVGSRSSLLSNQSWGGPRSPRPANAGVSSLQLGIGGGTPQRSRLDMSPQNRQRARSPSPSPIASGPNLL